MTENRIAFVGSRRLQNKLMARFLEQGPGYRCETVASVAELNTQGLGQSPSAQVVLWDCEDRDLADCMGELQADVSGLFHRSLVLLYNLRAASVLEERVLKQGAKGFLYSSDPIELFAKAIEAVLKGELWVSRDVLTKSFFRSRDGEHHPPIRSNPLTHRETEILVLVSGGAKNEDIAKELCISNNTVKTHIYNIFKKINVPNRLQAALWAVKNL